jgi:hypothetical protein
VRLLRVLVQNAKTATFGEHVNPLSLDWKLSDKSYASVQCTVYAGLAVSVFAACLAMLGKQWLNQYGQIEIRGSLIQRSRYRHREMTRIVAWNFDIVMEALPVMLQITLLPFCYGLSRYLWNINQMVAAVIITISSLGFVLYGCIIRVSVPNPSFSPPSVTRLLRCPQEWGLSRLRSHHGIIPELGTGLVCWSERMLCRSDIPI